MRTCEVYIIYAIATTASPHHAGWSHGARARILWYLIRFALCNPSPTVGRQHQQHAIRLFGNIHSWCAPGLHLSATNPHVRRRTSNWDDRYVWAGLHSGAWCFWENSSTDYHIMWICVNKVHHNRTCIINHLQRSTYALFGLVINLIHACVCWNWGAVHWTTKSLIHRTVIISVGQEATGRSVETSKSDNFLNLKS